MTCESCQGEGVVVWHGGGRVNATPCPVCPEPSEGHRFVRAPGGDVYDISCVDCGIDPWDFYNVRYPPCDRKPRIASAFVEAGELVIGLADGRLLTAPVNRLYRLAGATPDQLQNIQLLGRGRTGIRFPDVDEDLSLLGLIRDFPPA